MDTRATGLRTRGIRAVAALVLFSLPLGAAIPSALAEPEGLELYEAGGRKSGYLYMSEEMRALQDDDFLNPGMFAVELGRVLWERVEGEEGLSCASCHEDAAQSMKGVAASYPQYDEDRGGLVNLELRINQMRVDHMKADPFPFESEEMLALSAYVAFQSRGMPIEVKIDGAAAPYFEEGRDFFFKRRGQLDLSCSHCHDGLVGQRLRGDVISEGHVNGFPIYRMLWDAMGSRHRMFEWCNISLRSEPYELGSDEYLALELYVAWRSRGLPIEAPAVRR